MKNKYYEFNKNEVKIEMDKKKFDRKCKHCGYRNRILSKYKREICKRCGRFVFLNDFDEFEFRITERMNRRDYDK